MQPTGLEFRNSGCEAFPRTKIDGKAIPFWDKQRAKAAAKIMRMPQRSIVRVETSFERGWALWTGTRFVTRPEWIAAAEAAGIDLKSNDWHKF